MINKFLLTSFILINAPMASEPTDRSNQFVFKTELQGYTCERWGKKGFKTSSFEKQGYSFTTLDISRNTRRARINISQTSSKCTYSAIFDRKKGSVSPTFATSQVSDETKCSDMKANLDEFLSKGWNYKIQMNKYLSVEFHNPIASECGNNSYARFQYNVML